MNVNRYACSICTRITNCVEVGFQHYCEACFIAKLHDPDGKEQFTKVLADMGLVNIESS